MSSEMSPDGSDLRIIRIPAGPGHLEGELKIPQPAAGIVLFAHGSGSSRHSSRNQYVAAMLRKAGLGTLLFDLLTREEEIAEERTRHLRFDIGLLAERLTQTATWLLTQLSPRPPIGFFGASTGGAAALVAAAKLRETVHAVVSRGGRPDLAGPALPNVISPTLLLVGSRDEPVIDLNREAFNQLGCEKEICIVPGASHLFEEPGTLEQVANHASEWFLRYFAIE